MDCPFCNGTTYVIASEKSLNGVIRRRKCSKNHRFNTLEAMAPDDDIMRKKRVRKPPVKIVSVKPSSEGLLHRLALAGKI